MQGIGTLNETARNMYRGPSGVGAYQQFADGGEADMPEAELKRLESLYGGSAFNKFDIPVDGRVDFKTTADGQKMFDAEIAKTFDGERGSITPSARYSTQQSSRSMGDVVVDDDNRQIGFAIEGELYLDPDSENKLRGAIDIENSRQKRSFNFPDGEFVNTKDGVLKKFNLGAELGRLGLDATYTDDSKSGTRTQGSATIKIGKNGIIRYDDSSDGKPSFSARYSTDVGAGSLKYEEDPRNVPRYGAELNTTMGEGVGSFSYSSDGKGDRFGANYKINFANGGEVMQGVGSLNETARNMFRGGPVYMSNGGDSALNNASFEALLSAVIQTESGGDPNAVSEDDAIGLMQVLPSTAAQPGYEQYGAENVFDIAERLIGYDGDRSETDARNLLFNPKVNVEFGTKYLKAMIETTGGDIYGALQKYNAGPGNYANFENDPVKNPLDQEAVRYPGLVISALGIDPEGMFRQTGSRPFAAPREADPFVSTQGTEFDDFQPMLPTIGTPPPADAPLAVEELMEQGAVPPEQRDTTGIFDKYLERREEFMREEEGLVRPRLRPLGDGLTRSLRPRLRPTPPKPYGGSNPQGLKDGIESLRDRTFRKGFKTFQENPLGEPV